MKAVLLKAQPFLLPSKINNHLENDIVVNP